MRECEIFIQAADKEDEAERAAYLDAACRGDPELRERVEDLLKLDSKGGPFLLDEPPPFLDVSAEDHREEGPGTQIGPYKLIEPIGEGGFGVVFLAEQQEPVERRVALKLVKPGMDSRQVLGRFEAERQALALMDHPNIARVLDGGATGSGRPYFAMELVKGVPVTHYCDAERLPPKGRLELFLPVCRAVQHAHQKGIIHRDLKPSNVLVARCDGKPVPKVIDFGIAKPTGPNLTEGALTTRFGAVLGTPEYMSPEQAELGRLDIDTRSDIYSLGVLLYELLTGSTPLERKGLEEKKLLDVLRMIREEEPPAPSTRLGTTGELARIAADRGVEPKRLSAHVRGDLDWIVMKCLEKDRTRRYDTAGALALDLERYLHDEPVEARPPSRLYRFRKFARRRRVSLAAAGCLVFALAVLAGSIGWILRERVARELVLEREVAEALADAESWHRRGRLEAAIPAVRRAEGLLASGRGSDGLLQRVRRWRSDLDAAAALEKIRLEEVRERDGRFDWSGADQAYGEAFRRYGCDVEALAADEAAARIRSAAIREQLLAGLDHWALARHAAGLPGQERPLAVARRADADRWRNRLRDAFERRDREALAALAAEERDPGQPAAGALLLARMLRELGEPSLAARVLFQAQEQHPDDFWINFTLGYLLEGTDPAPAVGFYRAALALRPESPAAHLHLGNALFGQGELAAACAALRRGLSLHPDEPLLHMNLGTALSKMGEAEAAVAALRQCISLDPDDRVESMARYNLAGALYARGERGESIAELHRAIALDPKLFKARLNLGELLLEERRPDEAIAAFRAAIALEPGSAKAHDGCGAALGQSGRLDEAAAAHRKAIELEPRRAEGHYNLGVVLDRQGRPDEAIAAYRKAIELDPKLERALSNLGATLMKQGKLEEAMAEFRRVLELNPESFEGHHNLGTVLSDLGRLDEAIASLRKAILLKPGDPRSHESLGTALGRKGDIEAASVELRKAIALAPGDAQAHGTLGVALRMLGRHAEAMAAFRQAASLQPESAEAHYNLGVALGEQGELDEAAAAYRKALELQPGQPRVHNNLAMVLRRQGKASEAIAEYRRAIALQPDYADYHYNLGNVLTDRGEAGEAMALYRKAIELAPEHAEAHLNLGHALRAEGRFAEAVASLKRAHELGSRDPRWGYPTSRLIAEAERLATLDRKLPRVLAGEEQAADARERLAYADLCYRKRQFERAARFFEEAFAQDPALAADLSGSYRYNAACAAALSGAGEGRDAGAIAEEARARRRAQARDWLRADLEAHRRTFREDASTRTAVVRALEHWLHDPDLKGLREDELAAELPAEERAACGRLWSEVRELIESAGKEKP